MLVIGLAGTIGSGKDTVSDYLEERYDFRSFTMGDVVRDIAEKRGLEANRDNLQMLGKECREEKGKDFLAEKMAEKIRSRKGKKFVVNGVRTPEDYEVLKREFGDDFTLLLIQTKEKIRFKRLKERGRTGDPDTYEQFKRQDENDIEKFEMDETFKEADYTINNNGRIEDLYKKVDGFLKGVNLEIS